MQVSRGTVYLRGGPGRSAIPSAGAVFARRSVPIARWRRRCLRKRIVEAIEGRHFNVRNEGRIPFSEFAATYTERCISVLKSAKTERDRVQFWIREFGNRPIGQITRAELQDWQARKRRHASPRP